MKTNLPHVSLSGRVAREVERERHERLANDESRVGLSATEDYRIKDARENTSSSNLKRSSGR